MSELSKHADRMREMAHEKRDFLMNHDPRLSPQVLTQHADDIKTLMAGAKAMQRVKELEQELAEARKDSERLSHIIRQSSSRNGWLQDYVLVEVYYLEEYDRDEADGMQKWARLVIDKDMEDKNA
jgi:hypothetical protein